MLKRSSCPKAVFLKEKIKMSVPEALKANDKSKESGGERICLDFSLAFLGRVGEGVVLESDIGANMGFKFKRSGGEFWDLGGEMAFLTGAGGFMGELWSTIIRGSGRGAKMAELVKGAKIKVHQSSPIYLAGNGRWSLQEKGLILGEDEDFMWFEGLKFLLWMPNRDGSSSKASYEFLFDSEQGRVYPARGWTVSFSRRYPLFDVFLEPDGPCSEDILMEVARTRFLPVQAESGVLRGMKKRILARASLAEQKTTFLTAPLRALEDLMTTVGPDIHLELQQNLGTGNQFQHRKLWGANLAAISASKLFMEYLI